MTEYTQFFQTHSQRPLFNGPVAIPRPGGPYAAPMPPSLRGRPSSHSFRGSDPRPRPIPRGAPSTSQTNPGPASFRSSLARGRGLVPQPQNPPHQRTDRPRSNIALAQAPSSSASAPAPARFQPHRADNPRGMTVQPSTERSHPVTPSRPNPPFFQEPIAPLSQLADLDSGITPSAPASETLPSHRPSPNEISVVVDETTEDSHHGDSQPPEELEAAAAAAVPLVANALARPAAKKELDMTKWRHWDASFFGRLKGLLAEEARTWALQPPTGVCLAPARLDKETAPNNLPQFGKKVTVDWVCRYILRMEAHRSYADFTNRVALVQLHRWYCQRSHLIIKGEPVLKGEDRRIRSKIIGELMDSVSHPGGQPTNPGHKNRSDRKQWNRRMREMSRWMTLTKKFGNGVLLLPKETFKWPTT